MHRLIDDIIVNYLGSKESVLTDAARVYGTDNFPVGLTTDSYTVKPIFFNGGDIGKLAVAGTVNDLIVSGAKPLAMSLGLILEEGLDFDDLERIIKNIKHTADVAGVKIITGDTKVVNKNEADRIFINTSGVGIFKWDYQQDLNAIRPGDSVVINGFLGDHGTAVMIDRGEFKISANIPSDVFPLNNMLEKVLDEKLNVKFMRDCTRGGLAATLNEITEGQEWSITLAGKSIPVRKEVKAFCEILGLDPLYVANEGKAVIIVDKEDSDRLLEILKSFDEGKNSVMIGEVSEEHPGKVFMTTGIGGTRIVHMPSGELLPRIC